MIIIKLISIDTSILGSVAKSYYSKNTNQHQAALKFMHTIVDNGLIPFFSHHHLQELSQHNDDSVVHDRWSLIETLPNVAYLYNNKGKPSVGSIIDVHAAELKYLLKDQSLNMVEIIKKVKPDIIKYTSGKEFVNRFELEYLDMKKIGMFDTHKGKSIESLSHIRDLQTDNTKLSNLNYSKLKPFDEAKKWLESYADTVEESLRYEGDPKLDEHRNISDNFINQVIDDGKALYLNNRISLLENFVVSCGVDLSQTNSNTTVGDLGYLSMFNKKMAIVAKGYSYDLNEIKKLSEKIPSWIIWRELDKIIRTEKRAHGSNLLDKYMAVLALYVDFFISDKRICECFRQLQNKLPNLSEFENRVFKLSCFSDLEKKLFKYFDPTSN